MNLTGQMSNNLNMKEPVHNGTIHFNCSLSVLNPVGRSADQYQEDNCSWFIPSVMSNLSLDASGPYAFDLGVNIGHTYPLWQLPLSCTYYADGECNFTSFADNQKGPWQSYIVLSTSDIADDTIIDNLNVLVCYDAQSLERYVC
jgi:hypothetical protein